MEMIIYEERSDVPTYSNAFIFSDFSRFQSRKLPLIQNLKVIMLDQAGLPFSFHMTHMYTLTEKNNI